MRRWLSRWTPLLLLLTCLGMVYALMRPQPYPEVGMIAVAPAKGVADSPPPQPPASPSELNYYREVWERPLFSPERRPPEPAPSATGTAPATLSFSLEGIVLNGDTQRVLIRTRRNQLLRLDIGDQVEGWELAGADPAGAQFQRGGKIIDIALKPLPNVK